jgi:uncharacterized protein (TIGR02246 family)
MTETKTQTATSPAHLMELFAARLSAADVDGLVDLYEPHAVFQPEFGTCLTGHDQIRPALVEMMQIRPEITYQAAPDVLISGDVALVSNFWTMTGTAPDGSAVAEGGTSADVVRRQADGSWRVLIDQPRGVSTAA